MVRSWVILWLCFKVYICYISSLSYIIYFFFLLPSSSSSPKNLTAFRDTVSPFLRTKPQGPYRKLNFLLFIFSAVRSSGLLQSTSFLLFTLPSHHRLGLLAQAALADSSSKDHSLISSLKSHWSGRRGWTAGPEGGRVQRSISGETRLVLMPRQREHKGTCI